MNLNSVSVNGKPEKCTLEYLSHEHLTSVEGAKQSKPRLNMDNMWRFYHHILVKY